MTYYGWHDLPQGLWIFNEYFNYEKNIHILFVVQVDIQKMLKQNEFLEQSIEVSLINGKVKLYFWWTWKVRIQFELVCFQIIRNWKKSWQWFCLNMVWLRKIPSKIFKMHEIGVLFREFLYVAILVMRFHSKYQENNFQIRSNFRII